MDDNAPGLSDLLSIGLVCALMLAGGLLLGLLADGLMHTTPVFVLVGLLLGIIGAGSHIYRLTKRTLDDQNSQNRQTNQNSQNDPSSQD